MIRRLLQRTGPAERLILVTARQQWRLVALNLATSLLEAASEGAALAVVFMAVQVLSSQGQFNWSTNPLLSHWPALVELMNGLPRVSLFLGLLGLSVLLQFLQSSCRYLNALSTGYLAARCRALITQRIHSQILSFTYACASRYRVGDLGDLLGVGPEAVRIVIEQSNSFLVNALLIAVYLAVLIALSPWLLLMAVAMAVVITLVQRRLLPRIRNMAERVSADQQRVASQAIENIQGLRLLHSTGTINAADLQVASQMCSLEQSLSRQTQFVELIGPITQLLPVLTIAVLGGSSLLVFGDKSSGILPSLVTFVLALQRLNVRMGVVARVFTNLSENSGRMARLDSLLSPLDKRFRREGGIPFSSLKHSICLEQVCLQYPQAHRHALNGIDLEICKGETVALVGASGAGKSSVADILVGLVAPTSGRVLIDGTDLQQINPEQWQQRLGVVSQDTFLFNSSIAQNIAYGCRSASQAQIEAAAIAAQAHVFIQAMPDGYNTLIGERGYRLSGGQRQRLSLARAILRHPDLLILDEATSALDSQAEQLVQDAIGSLDSNITKLVIAHRLSTVTRADKIVVLSQGSVEQIGSHEQLLQDASGSYRKFWLYQSGVSFVSQTV